MCVHINGLERTSQHLYHLVVYSPVPLKYPPCRGPGLGTMSGPCLRSRQAPCEQLGIILGLYCVILGVILGYIGVILGL